MQAGSIIGKGWPVLKNSIRDCCEENSDPLDTLIEVLNNDQEIKERVIQLLQMDPCRRHAVLNKWLEQLRGKHAPPGMIPALTCLFADTVAMKLLKKLER